VHKAQGLAWAGAPCRAAAGGDIEPFVWMTAEATRIWLDRYPHAICIRRHPIGAGAPTGRRTRQRCRPWRPEAPGGGGTAARAGSQTAVSRPACAGD